MMQKRRRAVTSATDREFLSTLQNWLRARPEILVLIRYSRAAGSKDFEFFSSFEALTTRFGQLNGSASCRWPLSALASRYGRRDRGCGS